MRLILLDHLARSGVPVLQALGFSSSDEQKIRTSEVIVWKGRVFKRCPSVYVNEREVYFREVVVFSLPESIDENWAIAIKEG